MKTLILAGESEKNISWLEEISGLIVDSICHFYEHWETGENKIDFQREVERLGQEDYAVDRIVAKSAGTVVALYAIDAGVVTPEKCVFMGIPVMWAEIRGFKEDLVYLIENHNVSTTYIQQENDPFCSAAELAELTGKDVHEISGGNHKYDDFPAILEKL